MTGDRDPTIDGGLWFELTQDEAKDFIMAQREQINKLKDDVRALCHILRLRGADLVRYGVENDPERQQQPSMERDDA